MDASILCIISAFSSLHWEGNLGKSCNYSGRLFSSNILENSLLLETIPNKHAIVLKLTAEAKQYLPVLESFNASLSI